MRQSQQRFPDARERPEKIMSVRARAPVYATVALLALGFSGILMPSRAGMPKAGLVVQPGVAEALETPRAEISAFPQGDSAQPGGAGISGAPRAGMPVFDPADRAQPPDAGLPSAARDYFPPPAHRTHKATRARPQVKTPPLTRNPTTQLNQQEVARHRASLQPQRNPVSAFVGWFR